MMKSSLEPIKSFEVKKRQVQVLVYCFRAAVPIKVLLIDYMQVGFYSLFCYLHLVEHIIVYLQSPNILYATNRFCHNPVLLKTC